MYPQLTGEYNSTNLSDKMWFWLLPVSLLMVGVSGHGHLQLPYVWQDSDMDGNECLPVGEYPNIRGKKDA